MSELLVTYLALLAEIKLSGVLARATRQSREPEGEESQLLTSSHSIIIGSFCPPCVQGCFDLS